MKIPEILKALGELLLIIENNRFAARVLIAVTALAAITAVLAGVR